MPDARLLEPVLEPGDTVAVVSPSWPGAARWPHRLERGIAFLESLGLFIDLMPSSLAGDPERLVPASAEVRAADINEAFARTDVRLVLSAIGGHGAVDVLPFLDRTVIRASSAAFQGSSDATAILWWLAAETGTRTFYGPSLLTDLAEFPEPHPYMVASAKRAWFERWDGLDASPTWTDERLDWDRRLDETRPRILASNSGWVVVRPGRARGTLLPVSLETWSDDIIDQGRELDTPGSILLVDISDNDPSVDAIAARLDRLRTVDSFTDVVAVGIGRLAGFPRRSWPRVWELVAAALRDVPIVANLDFGHGTPAATIPLGIETELDAEERSLRPLAFGAVGANT